MNDIIRVNECFASIQGEGFYTGTPCYFIRTQGCRIGCKFCDSKSTWDPNGGTSMTFQEILDQIPEHIWHIVITGGEPTLHNNLPDLVRTLAQKGYRVHIETSGNHYDVLKELYNPTWVWWVTISPKQSIPTSDVLLLADEIKWVIQTEEDLWMVDEIWEELEESRCGVTRNVLEPKTTVNSLGKQGFAANGLGRK